MTDLEMGFYLVRKDDGGVRLVRTEPRSDGGFNLVDEYGGVYSVGEVLIDDLNKGPLSVSTVEALIRLDRQRVKFVDEGLAGLAALEEREIKPQ